ncbi:MAG: hypothetical protein OEZ22_06195 [Spirochaetia bacterium]|nr:hypothetical protein [Spirochaetia bacterium]
MTAIILQKKVVNDTSLLLKTISEKGLLQYFKIPGILKSQKRSSMLLSAGNIWNFTTNNNIKKTIIPREFNLVQSPFDKEVKYDELKQIAELLKIFDFFFSNLELPSLYKKLYSLLEKWPVLNLDERNNKINRFYLFFLQEMGLFNFSDLCQKCKKPLNENDYYFLAEGTLCETCGKSNIVLDKNYFSYGWVSTCYYDKSINVIDKYNNLSRANRNLICNFLSESI